MQQTNDARAWLTSTLYTGSMNSFISIAESLTSVPEEDGEDEYDSETCDFDLDFDDMSDCEGEECGIKRTGSAIIKRTRLANKAAVRTTCTNSAHHRADHDSRPNTNCDESASQEEARSLQDFTNPTRYSPGDLGGMQSNDYVRKDASEDTGGKPRRGVQEHSMGSFLELMRGYTNANAL